MEKTNVMRILEQHKIPYIPHEYDSSVRSGSGIVEALGENPDSTFKTLVTVSEKNIPFVFVIPVNREIDLKAAARTAGVKSLSMLKQKELLPLTGYIHGGCSPIGMKKQFRTFLYETALSFPMIAYSAGKVGTQVETSPHDLLSLISAGIAPLSVAVKE